MGWKKDLKQASQGGLTQKEIKQINQQYGNVNRADINQRIEQQGYQVGRAPTPQNTFPQNFQGTPGQFATPGNVYGQAPGQAVFDGASWQRAQAGGFSDQQIRDYLMQGNPNLQVGRRPQMVLDNWANENPESYRQYAQGPAAQYSTPGRVLFNPEGEKNIGLGRGGLQDFGISWYSVQGSPENDLSQAPYNPQVALDILENGRYLQTAEGMQRAMNGESPVPTRYMGNEQGMPTDGGQYAYGYNNYTSPGAQRYAQNANYQGYGQAAPNFDWNAWSNAAYAQQAAALETMDGMNAQFLRGIEEQRRGQPVIPDNTSMTRRKKAKKPAANPLTIQRT